MSSDILTEFRARRKELGLTAAQVAGDLNVSPATITMWETGKRAIPLKRAEQYAYYLGMTMTVERWRTSPCGCGSNLSIQTEGLEHWHAESIERGIIGQVSIGYYEPKGLA